MVDGAATDGHLLLPGPDIEGSKGLYLWIRCDYARVVDGLGAELSEAR